jgi:hypothetical protein
METLDKLKYCLLLQSMMCRAHRAGATGKIVLVALGIHRMLEFVTALPMMVDAFLC